MTSIAGNKNILYISIYIYMCVCERKSEREKNIKLLFIDDNFTFIDEVKMTSASQTREIQTPHFKDSHSSQYLCYMIVFFSKIYDLIKTIKCNREKKEKDFLEF